MFDNKIDSIKTQGELPLSHHTISGVKFSALSSGDKALLYTVLVVILYLLIEVALYYYHKFTDEHKIDE